MSKMKEFKVGYISTEVYKVEKFGNTFKLIDSSGTKVGTMGITTGTRKKAYQNRSNLKWENKQKGEIS